MFAQYGSAIGGLVLVQAMLQQYCPSEIRDLLERYFHKGVSFFDPYIEISFHEFPGKYMKRSEAFTAIQNYLTENAASRAKRLNADSVKDNRPLILTMADHEQVTDEYHGVQITWYANKTVPATTTFSFYPVTQNLRYYTLKFHRRDRKLITQSYIDHVLTEGKAIVSRNRQLKLYTNDPQDSMWIHALFKHPATFETLAMHPDKKREIMNDLTKFTEGKEYYAKIGKAWKRGYLLYGPPGTGKSTMIAAMANFLNYNVYDLELTAVKDNTELRRLLIETSSKSIIVIEDIDCSLDLTGQRKKAEEEEYDMDDDDPVKKMTRTEKKSSKVTLSGLLNFIDGIWSACGGERIIVFTTNHVDKLDPALIRSGRMDKHIEMSYCCFEAFKVLARNYLDIEHHPLFETISRLFGETDMTPADVAENLLSKSDGKDAEACLGNLIQALEAAKKKDEEEARLEAKRERREKRLKWWRETTKKAKRMLKKGN
ncbi:AAA-ATPase At3g28580-like [Rhodamnia argentea]|uniref:AAA-ATPase At3g28580-like n=1 Tax=Rhodamnia argentea TaxID=178133 RepID=A0ABM3GX61_9MYRT|nr:AAA-ATPase At3g28580-like [Rhodamnia argentea]XP_048128952.1 AAA-ATPase At3g28580-like [Rhodamnia argentea]